MATVARKTAKPAIRSTDRGGMVSFALGVLLVSFAIGLLLGLFQQTTSSSLRWLLHICLGLGGLLHLAVPLLVLWLGVLLVVSSRRYVSFLPFVYVFMAFLCVGALVTMLTNVQGFGTLMDYVLKLNQNHLGVTDPGGFGAFLSRSFDRYADTMSPVPGGGWLGMLLAYPLWRLLGTIGGSTLLIVSLVVLFFLLIGRTPLSLLRGMTARMPARGSQMPDTAEYPEELAPAAAESNPYTVPDHVYRRPDKTEPAHRPVTPDQVEPDTETANPAAAYTTHAVPLPAYTPPRPAAYREKPEIEGFVPVTMEESAPYPDTNTPRRAIPVHTTLPQSAPEPAPAAAEPRTEAFARRAGARKAPDPAVAASHDIPPAPASAPVTQPAIPAKASVVPPQPATEDKPQPKPPVASAILRDKPIREVTTDPAVPLTGQRVRVSPLAPVSRPAEWRMDGMVDGTQRKPGQLQMPLANYERPPFELLTEPPVNKDTDTTSIDQARADKLVQTLDSFNISATVQEVVHGPAITRFAIRLAVGVNVNRLRSVMDNLSVELLAKSPVRAEIPIPGTRLIGIEVSNDKSTTVYLREVLESQKMREAKTPTTVALGLDITGTPVLCDLMDMPHLLIAGATGSGKSVCINSIITSLLYCASPDTVRLILVDPKFVELQPYNDVPHLLLPVITDPKKAVSALEWVCQEMDERYQKLQRSGVRNLDMYNAMLAPDEEKLPRLIVIVDEMSDLMVTCGKIIDEHIKRITAKARAAGICLILATQRPSVDVITGIIKANIPSRIAFQVSSLVDSRTILDGTGAEKLLGYGDMLYLPRNYSSPKRVQGCLVTDADVNRVVNFVKSRNQANYNAEIMDHIESGGNEANGNGNGVSNPDDVDGAEFDELLPKAIEMAVESGQMSISMLQRVLRVGYGRAGRLIDEMARRGIISGNEGTKARKTLITREEFGGLPIDL